MDMTIRMVLGVSMGVILVTKIEGYAVPQYLGEVDDMGPMGMLDDDMQVGQAMDKRKGFDSMSGYTFGKKKRNFDEIDRAGFGAFVKRSPDIKRNFYEMDRAGFGAFVKRFPGPSKRNFDEIDRAGFGAFVKRTPTKRYFDEIDRAGFGAFVKRNFDEIDKVGFGAFNRKF